MYHNNKAPTFKCKVEKCGKVYQYKSTLYEHVRRIHRKIRHKCNQCQNDYRHSYNLKIHIITKHSEKPPQLKCDHCDKTYTKKQNLQFHINSIHKGVRYGCEQCDKKFIAQKDLKFHIKKVHEKRVTTEYKCGVCDMTYESRSGLYDHTISIQQTFRKYCEIQV